MLRAGHSWSGHEQNCCFLNLDGERFADISYVSGMGYFDDARSICRTDWDVDGDLDVVINNRSAPRIRLMRNEYNGDAHYVAFGLIGATCNRDAIGARVTVESKGRQFSKTLTAGSSYMGQTSKWVHFGLGTQDRIDRVTVHWPDRTNSTHTGVAVDGRYVIRQGQTEASLFPGPKVGQTLEARATEIPPIQTANGVPLAFRIQMPDLTFEDFDGKTHAVSDYQGKPLLVNFWANWCSGCLEELGAFTQDREVFEKNGIGILAVSVDKPEDHKKAERLSKRLGLWFPNGLGSEQWINFINVVRFVMFEKYEQMPMPSSLLLDHEGRIVRYYAGPVKPEQIVKDLPPAETGDREFMLNACAASGRWLQPHYFLRAPLISRKLELAEGLNNSNESELALFYARPMLEELKGINPPEAMKTHVAQVCRALGNNLLEHGNIDASIDMLNASFETVPDESIWYRLTEAYLAGGDPELLAKASAAYDRAIENSPQPEGAIACARHGANLFNLGRREEAIPYLQEALEGSPDNTVARVQLAIALVERESYAEAIPHFEEALGKIAPSTLQLHSYGIALARTGRMEDAVSQFSRVLQLDPNHLDAKRMSGLAYEYLQQTDQAVEHYATYVTHAPEDFTTRMRLAEMLSRLGRCAEAIKHYRAVLEGQPENAKAKCYLAWLLATAHDAKLRDARRSLVLANEARDSLGDVQPMILDTLAAAYAENSDFPKAIQYADQAISLAKEMNLDWMVQAIGERKALYADGKPFHNTQPQTDR